MDTLEDVDIDDDVDTELEVDTLKNKKSITIIHQTKTGILSDCEKKITPEKV